MKLEFGKVKRGDNMTAGDDFFNGVIDDHKWIEYLEGVVEQSENALRELPNINSKRNLSPLVDLM